MADNNLVQVGLAPVAVRLPGSSAENQVVTNAGPGSVLLESAPNYVLSAGGSGYAAVTPGVPFPPGSRLELIRNGTPVYANTTALGSTITSPAVPATTVAATNNTGSAVAVTIGGTGVITAIAVSGVTVLAGTNLTGSVIAVPAGGTITLTYSSGTPTWTWSTSIPANLRVQAGVQLS